MDSCDLTIRVAGPGDARWIAAHLTAAWGSTTVVSRGVAHDGRRLPALLALAGAQIVGCATYRHAGGQTELVTLDALRPGGGIGTALLRAVAREAAGVGSRRLWLVTSNDNVDALRFYQRRGLRLVAVHRGAIDEARRVKPSIPQLGVHGIPVHDELELALSRERNPARPRGFDH